MMEEEVKNKVTEPDPADQQSAQEYEARLKYVLENLPPSRHETRPALQAAA
jgi:hypothetical protein